MQITAHALRSSVLDRAMTDLRATYDDLTRQLSSGKVSDTYGGLGSGRSIALAMQAKIADMQGYRQTIGSVDLRVNMLSTSLTRLGQLASDQRSDTDPDDNTVIANGQTRAQVDARLRFEEALSVLGTDVAGSYIFGGRATDKSPVETPDKIMDGDGTKIGLKAVIAERRAADTGIVDVDLAGTDSVGRLTIGASTGTDFTIAEDGVHPFGFKLAGGATTISGATITTPAGSPAAARRGADEPGVRRADGAPDRQSAGRHDRRHRPHRREHRQRMRASSRSARPSPIPSTNLRSAIVKALDTRSQTTLAAASSVVAGKDFFAGGPAHAA